MISQAHALRLYRRRLPECNVDLPPDVPCSPAHPGLSPQRKRRGADFLHLLVHGQGARTAVARLEGKESIVGALTLIPHAAASFCEARGASLSRHCARLSLHSCTREHRCSSSPSRAATLAAAS